MKPEPTYYELLGLMPTATRDEVKGAYREQLKRIHPDFGGSTGLFRMVEMAHDTLTDPHRRAEYDRSLRLRHSSRSASNRYAWTDDEVGSDGPPTGEYDLSDLWGESARYEDREAPVEPEPQYVTSSRPFHGSALSGRRWPVKSIVVFAAVAWFVFAMLAGTPVLPGVNNGNLVVLALLAMLAWTLGSAVLRLAGWGLLIFALVDARWSDTASMITLQRCLIAVTLWLAGHWLYVFRRGEWHSSVAFSVLGRLPGYLRPDRRFG